MLKFKKIKRSENSQSLIENDPLKKFFELSPVLAGFLVALAGPIWLSLVELFRRIFDKKRPPWALNSFRWNAAGFGDFFFLSGLSSCICTFYQGKTVNSGNFFSSLNFSLIFIFLSVLISLGFIAQEEIRKVYLESERYTFSRIWHFFYFVALFYIVASFCARLAFTGFSGEKATFSLALVFLGGYFVTQVLDWLEWKNPIWKWALSHYNDSENWNK